MRKILSAWMIFLFCLVALNLRAQTFDVAPNDTLEVTIAFNDFSILGIFQTNLSTTDSLFFEWETLNYFIPSGWDYSLCDFGSCMAGIPDSGLMNPVAPLDQGFLDLNINPFDISGTALVNIIVRDSLYPSNIDTVTWIITAAPGTGITNADENNFLVYPNPASDLVHLETTESGEVFIYSIAGTLLQSFNKNLTDKAISLQHLPSGYYWIEWRGISGNVKLVPLQKL